MNVYNTNTSTSGRDKGMLRFVKPYLEDSPSIKLSNKLTNFTSLLVLSGSIQMNVEYVKYIFEEVYQVGLVSNTHEFMKTNKDGMNYHLIILEFGHVYNHTPAVVVLKDTLKTYGYSDFCVANELNETDYLTLRVFYDKHIDRMVKYHQEIHKIQQIHHPHQIQQIHQPFQIPQFYQVPQIPQIQSYDIVDTETEIIQEKLNRIQTKNDDLQKNLDELTKQNKNLQEELHNSAEREKALEKRVQKIEESNMWNQKLLFNRCNELDWRLEDIQKTINDMYRKGSS